jgi:hypothetical protein
MALASIALRGCFRDSRPVVETVVILVNKRHMTREGSLPKQG